MQNLDESILQKVIKARPQESFKGTFGKIVLVGGNENFGGAIIMAATAAVYGGGGFWLGGGRAPPRRPGDDRHGHQRGGPRQDHPGR